MVIAGLKELSKKIEENTKAIKKIMETLPDLSHYMWVSPQIFDFLKSVQVDLDKDSKPEDRVYHIYTRKARGKKFYNPTIMVDEEMLKAIVTVLRNHKSSIRSISREIKFYPDTRELRIWGFSMYIKKDSPRYDLCKYMFGKKRHPQGWQFWDLAVAIGEKPDIDGIEKLKPKVRGKIRYLNQDISDAIGIQEFIVEEAGKFVINPVHIPKYH